MYSDKWIRFAAWVVAWLFSELPVRAQCHTWSTEFGNSLTGRVNALQPFDDGTGELLWVGGGFFVTGTQQVFIARWNGRNWVPTPDQFFDEALLCFGVFDGGAGSSIYAGGFFSEGIARWNGSAWVSVGGGLGGGPLPPGVSSMASFDAGNGAELYVGGGQFYPAGPGGKAIARWSGSYWAPLGNGLASTNSNGPVVGALHVFDDGSGPALYVGGIFTSAGGVPVNGLARWNGSQWSAVGSNGSDVVAFGTFNDGNGPALYATGTFQLPGGGTTNLARWDGVTWVAVAFPGYSNSFAVCDDGDGPALFDGWAVKWNGQSWTALGHWPNGPIFALNVYDEKNGNGPEVFFGGEFTQVGGGIPSRGIAKWVSCKTPPSTGFPFQPFCPGDATLAHCPCDNFGQSGRGCDNSIGTGGALLTASGNVNPDTLVLTSNYELPSALSIFLQGNAVTQYVQPFGDGLRCIGGQLLRLYVKNAQNGAAVAPRLGDPSISVRSAALGDPIPPGSLRFYQVYYRDPNLSFCAGPTGGTFNVSNGMRVVW